MARKAKLVESRTLERYPEAIVADLRLKEFYFSEANFNRTGTDMAVEQSASQSGPLHSLLEPAIAEYRAAFAMGQTSRSPLQWQTPALLW
ncbi:MAG: hypothetical protein EKK33_17980 [Bradyrhizobiaceae bacterium]|nr:MAG: hypothetical protein EKK33_17980 [Bradyrhizobiaceae bacterium]